MWKGPAEVLVRARSTNAGRTHSLFVPISLHGSRVSLNRLVTEELEFELLESGHHCRGLRGFLHDAERQREHRVLRVDVLQSVVTALVHVRNRVAGSHSGMVERWPTKAKSVTRFYVTRWAEPA